MTHNAVPVPAKPLFLASGSSGGNFCYSYYYVSSGIYTKQKAAPAAPSRATSGIELIPYTGEFRPRYLQELERVNG